MGEKVTEAAITVPAYLTTLKGKRQKTPEGLPALMLNGLLMNQPQLL